MNTEVDSSENPPLSFGRQIAYARQRSYHTSHKFAQLMGIKLRLLEDFENDVIVPEKKHVAKMNRFLVVKLSYPIQTR